MKDSRWLSFILSVVILIGVMPLAAGAAESVAFRMTIEERGDTVEIGVYAEHVNDLYAFDLILETDSDRLKLKEAKSGITGFTVGPLMEGDRIRFAHTKTGSSPGSNGEVKLAAYVFERIGGEPAAVRFIRAQLVDSKLEMTEIAPALSAAVRRSALWNDVAGHWAEAFIRSAMERGIVDGYPDGAFRPDRMLTRAEFATMLVKVRELPTSDHSELAFADKADIPAWARPYIATAVEAGLVVGYEDGTFRSDRPILREEMAAIIVRASALDGAGRTAGSGAAYAEDNLISDWARPYVAAVSEAGIMNGRSGNRFAPLATSTRAEAVTVLMRIVK